MRNNKTGQFNQVMILLLILASAIIILLFVTKYVSKSTMDESISACRLSVITQSATAWGVVSKTSPLDINCDKRYVNFYNTQAELGLSLENMNAINIDYGDRKSKKFTELNEFVVDQVLAEELRVCKFEFGDGQIKIFPNDKSGMLNDKNVCFVCSEIHFEPGVGQQTFTNLVDYTKKTTFTDAGTSYYNYLTATTVFDDPMWQQGVDVSTDSTAKLNIDSSKSYLIVVNKFAFWKGRLLKYTNLLTFFMPIRAKDAISVSIIPADDINKFCDEQAS